MVVRWVTFQGLDDKFEDVLSIDRVEEARPMLQQDGLMAYESMDVRPFLSFSGLAPTLFQYKLQKPNEPAPGLAALNLCHTWIPDGLTILRGQDSPVPCSYNLDDA